MHNIRDELNRTLGRFFSLSAQDRLVEANDILDQLRAVMSEVSDSRRMAVRELRGEGWSLREISEIIGTTPQRIHQIELGYNRKEKADRKRA
jgi:DNA-directed RNA polymerase specialized sigma24 family protein